MSEFPIIWMREHDEDEDEQAAQNEMVACLERDERFVLISERMPTMEDFNHDTPEERRVRAKLFKTYRGELSRLCCGMIVVGRAGNLPVAWQKIVQGVSALIGVPMLFVDSIDQARIIADRQLAA